MSDPGFLIVLFVLSVMLFMHFKSIFYTKPNPQINTEKQQEPNNSTSLMVESPVQLEEFIGQKKAVTLLKVHIIAAQKRGMPMPHTILEGSGGTGKTTLALCVGNELSTKTFITTPSTFKDKDSVINFFFNKDGNCRIGEGDVIFIDEIHRLREAAAIYIYSAMQDFYIDIGGQILQLPKFTVVGATTDIGMLPGPFRDRFKVRLTLDKYGFDDIAEIVTQFKNIEPGIAEEISLRSCGIPRLAKSLSDNVIAIAIAEDKETIDLNCVNRACDLLEIDETGLNKTALRTVYFLQNNGNRPIGVTSLANALNISKDTLEHEIYPMLFSQELLTSRGTQGKCLTTKGLEYGKESD